MSYIFVVSSRLEMLEFKPNSSEIQIIGLERSGKVREPFGSGRVDILYEVSKSNLHNTWEPDHLNFTCPIFTMIEWSHIKFYSFGGSVMANLGKSPPN